MDECARWAVPKASSVHQIKIPSGITDVDVSQGGEGLSEFLDLFGICFCLFAFFVFTTAFLFDVETQVLKQND